jgi:hypothetical protein
MGRTRERVSDRLRLFNRLVRGCLARNSSSNHGDQRTVVRDVEAGLADVSGGRVVSDADMRRHFEQKLGSIRWR